MLNYKQLVVSVEQIVKTASNGYQHRTVIQRDENPKADSSVLFRNNSKSQNKLPNQFSFHL